MQSTRIRVVSLSSLIYCVISLRVSPVYAKYVSTAIHYIEFPQKISSQRFPFSALIILDLYPYVSQFPDLLCNIASSVTGLRKIRFNGYTLHRVSTKNQFPKISVFRVDNFRFISLRFSVP